MKFQAVIFDLDGTISDSAALWRKATLDLLTSRDTPITEKKVVELSNRLSGIGLGNFCSTIKQEFGLKKSAETLVEEIKHRACQLYKNKLSFIDGFEQFHHKVAALKLKSGIATSSDDNTLSAAKRRLNLKRFFGNHIYGISSVNYRYKPDPAIYLHAAHKLGVDPQDCLAIEDSPAGISSAQKAGIYCIGINTAGMPKAISHADIVVNSYKEIDLKKLLAIDTKKLDRSSLGC